MVYALLVVGLAASACFIVKRDRKGGAKALLLKMISSLLFILMGLFIITEGLFDLDFIFFFVLGQVFCLAGDILLDLKITYPKDNDLYTYAGMSCFGLGQLLYLAAFAFTFGTHWAILPIAVGLAALTIVISKFVIKMDMGKFIYISTLYAFALALMFAQTGYLLITGESAFTILLFIGALCFLLSDVILSQTYFNGKDSKLAIASNHILYYAAQFLIALSLYYI